MGEVGTAKAMLSTATTRAKSAVPTSLLSTQCLMELKKLVGSIVGKKDSRRMPGRSPSGIQI